MHPWFTLLTLWCNHIFSCYFCWELIPSVAEVLCLILLYLSEDISTLSFGCLMIPGHLSQGLELLKLATTFSFTEFPPPNILVLSIFHTKTLFPVQSWAYCTKKIIKHIRIVLYVFYTLLCMYTQSHCTLSL